MKYFSVCGFILALFWAFFCSDRVARAETADLILKNGKIYTVNDKQKWAEAVAVREGKIIYVGDNAGSAAFEDSKTKIIDLKDKLLLPGFIDGHDHAYGMASILYELIFPQLGSAEEYQQAIRAFRAKNPAIVQLKGKGWDKIEKQAKQQGQLPKQLIDMAAADIPVAITDTSAHNLFANSKALELAGVTRNMPDPAGGTIERDANGEPTGVMREFAAQALIIKALPQPDFTQAQYQQGLLAWQKLAAKDGITAVLVPLHELPRNMFEAFKFLDANNQLTAAYDLAIWVDESKSVEQIERLKQIRSQYRGRHYKIDSVKIFSDGVGEPKLVWNQENLEKVVAALDKEHFRIFVHSVGNPDFYPSHNVLNALEYARKVNGARDSRHAITHLDWVMEEDVPRFKQLGVFAVPQPAWFYRDWYDNTAPDKVKNKQRFKTFVNVGVTVVSSSDFPWADKIYETIYPLAGIEIGMTRLAPGTDPKKANQKPGEAQEKASLEDMIASYTINAAGMLFAEKNMGSVEVGKNANFTVLDKNLFTIPVQEIAKTKILMTIFEGKEIYCSASFN